MSLALTCFHVRVGIAWTFEGSFAHRYLPASAETSSLSSSSVFGLGLSVCVGACCVCVLRELQVFSGFRLRDASRRPGQCSLLFAAKKCAGEAFRSFAGWMLLMLLGMQLIAPMDVVTSASCVICTNGAIASMGVIVSVAEWINVTMDQEKP